MDGFDVESEYQTTREVRNIEFIDAGSKFIAHNEKEIKLFQITAASSEGDFRLAPLLHISNMHRFHLHTLAHKSGVNGVTLTADEITCNLWSLEDPQTYTQVCTL